MLKNIQIKLVAVIMLVLLSNSLSPATTGAMRPPFTNEGCWADSHGGGAGNLDLGFNMNFFGRAYSQLQWDTSGFIELGYGQDDLHPYDASLLISQRIMIAPFLADVYAPPAPYPLPCPLSSGTGIIMYPGSLNVYKAFSVTWQGVGYMGLDNNDYVYDNQSKTNSFQLVIIDRPDLGISIDQNGIISDTCTIEFNYNQIQWEASDVSNGINGLGGNSAHVGFSNTVFTLELPGSGVNGALLDDNQVTGLIHNSMSSNIPGRYCFLSTFIPVTPINGTWPYPTYFYPMNICLDGCPVDLSSGEEEYLADSDIVIAAPSGLKAGFTRSYYTTRAKAAYGSPGLTQGWVHNYDDIIVPSQAGSWGTLYLSESAGGSEPLTPILDDNGAPTGAFSLQPGSPMCAVGTPSTTTGIWSTITVTKSDGSKKTFSNWQATPGMLALSSITDKLGRSISLQWDTNRRLQSITDVASSTTLLTCNYDTNGLLMNIQDNAGRKVQYTCAVPGNGINVSCITSVSQICASTATNPPDLTTYSYTAYNGAPLIASYAQPSPSGQGQQTVAFTYSITGRVSTQTMPNGTIHQYVYGDQQTTVNTLDAQNNLLTTRTEFFDAIGRKLGVQDANGNRDHYAYADIGNLYRQTQYIARDGKTTNYTYNQFGDVLTMTDARNLTTTNTYDYTQWPFGRLMQVQQGNKQSTSMTYLEPSGLLHTKTTPLPGTTTGASCTTTLTYDFQQNQANNFGRPVAIAHPGNNTASVITETFSYNYISDPTYDANGNPGTFTTTSNGLPLTITDRHHRTTHLRYDARGNVIISIDPDGRRTDTVYNLADQPTSVTMPAATASSGRRSIITEYQYPGGLPWRVTTYGAQNNQLRQVVTTYDIDGNKLSVTGGPDPVSYLYDAQDRLITLIDGNNHSTGYSYDNLGRLSQTTYPDGHTQQNISFDNVGRVLESVDGNDVYTTYTYTEPGGLLTTMDHQNTTGVDAAYVYDNYGRLTSVTDLTGSRSYTYDDNDLPITVTTNYTGLSGKIISYQYYPDGNQKQLNSPAGIFSYLYDTDGAMTTLTDPTGHSSRWSYLPDKQIQKQQLGNRAWTSYNYNLIGQLTGQTNYTAKGRMLSRYNGITRDELDNITASNGTLPGMPTQDGAAGYTYDSLSQLTQSNWMPSLGGTAQSQTAAYDTAGNPTQFPHDLPGYTGMTRAYNSSNQWVGYHNGQGQPVGDNLFNYDGNGNPTTYKGDTLAYSDDNGLTSYTSGANNQVLMTAGYTAAGLRAWKSSNGVKTYFLYNGTQLLCELDLNGNVTHYNISGIAGLLGRVNVQTAQSTWYLFDDVGNVLHRLDVTGKVLSTDQYDAWGNLLSGGDISDPFKYKGQYGYYMDDEIGLILCIHRYYDPMTGQWITRDPIGYRGGINLYEYCKNGNINK